MVFFPFLYILSVYWENKGKKINSIRFSDGYIEKSFMHSRIQVDTVVVCFLFLIGLQKFRTRSTIEIMCK